MQSTQEFIEGVLAYYAAHDICPLDPNEGTWHKAHHPIPRHQGGRKTVWLLKEHHAIHGILQSEECGHPSIFGWELQEVLQGHLVAGWFELMDGFKKWRSELARLAASCLHQEKTRNGRSRAAVRASHCRWAK